MSYIRMNQDSPYVDIHNGSRAYIYSTGSHIAGLEQSYGQFIDALYIHANSAELERVDNFERSLENHYGEARSTAERIGPAPEMAHIVAQHLEQRLDSMELTDSDREKLQLYADQAYVECPRCEELHRQRQSPDHQDDLCRECHKQNLLAKDVSADLSELLEFIDELPDNEPVIGEQDDEFFMLCTQKAREFDGEKREALIWQLNQYCDMLMDAAIEEEPAPKDIIRKGLESINE